jgi:hypothetical protein
MNRLLITITFLLVTLATTNLLSQTQSTAIFSSGGGVVQNSSYTNISTFGQTFAQTVNNVNNTLKEGFMNSQYQLANNLNISDDYNNSSVIWGFDHYDDLDLAMKSSFPNSTINISNYTYIGDIDLSGYNVIVGDDDFSIDGKIIDGLVYTPNNGSLKILSTTNGSKTFPLTNDGTTNFTIDVAPSSEPNIPFKVRLVPKNEVPNSDGMLSNTLWDISGENNLNTTLIFNIPDSSIENGTLPETIVFRFWNGTRYQAISAENVTIVDNGTYYTVTIENVNQF